MTDIESRISSVLVNHYHETLTSHTISVIAEEIRDCINVMDE